MLLILLLCLFFDFRCSDGVREGDVVWSVGGIVVSLLLWMIAGVGD